MDIYPILASKPHNPHYLKRYVKFIEDCCEYNFRNLPNIVEKHHICPRAKDMFPEYESFSAHRWNRADLTPRQHFIAHLLLWKTYPSVSSQSYALWAMKNQNSQKINSTHYEKLKISALAAISENMKGRVTVVDKEGNYLKVNVDDKNYQNGLYTHNTKGKIVVRNDPGDTLQISIADYHESQDIYSPINRGKIVVRDSNGNILQVDSNDQRYLNGNLIFYANGMKRSDEFKMKQSIAHSGKVNIKNKVTGEIIRVSLDDPKTNDELYIPMNLGKKHSKESKMKRSAALKGKSKENVVCRIDNKKEMTLANFMKWLNGSYNNGGPKPRICRLFDRKEMSVNHYTRWLKKIEVATQI